MDTILNCPLPIANCQLNDKEATAAILPGNADVHFVPCCCSIGNGQLTIGNL
jgi:hypothetical protein